MKTILIIFAIYWSGYFVAWVIASRAIKKYKTGESAFKGALFSWIIPIVTLIHWVLYQTSAKYRETIEK